MHRKLLIATEIFKLLYDILSNTYRLGNVRFAFQSLSEEMYNEMVLYFKYFNVNTLSIRILIDWTV